MISNSFTCISTSRQLPSLKATPRRENCKRLRNNSTLPRNRHDSESSNLNGTAKQALSKPTLTPSQASPHSDLSTSTMHATKLIEEIHREWRSRHNWRKNLFHVLVQSYDFTQNSSVLRFIRFSLWFPLETLASPFSAPVIFKSGLWTEFLQRAEDLSVEDGCPGG